MKKKIILLFVIIILMSTSGCGVFNKKPIKIGFVGTLQGPTASLAINGKRGAEIAVEQINDGGGINGRKLELVVKDSVNDKKVAKDILQEFLEEGIEIVIGDYVSSLTESIMDDLKDNNILYISPTVASERFVGLDDNLVRLNGTSIDEADIIFAQTQKNDDKVFIIFKDSNNSEFTYSVSDHFKKNVESAGGSVLTEIVYDARHTINPDDIIATMNEYSQQIDGVVLVSDAVNAAIIIKTIKANGFETDIYNSRWGNTPDLYSITGKDCEGIYTSAIVYQESESEKFTDFAAKFNEFYGTKPTFPSVSSYEAVMVLSEAISETGSTKHTKVKDYIINTGNFSGLQSDFRIDEFGDCHREYVLCVVKDGKPVKMD